MNIGQNVKRIREQQRYTQTEIARRCGVTPAAISGLEHGDFNPSTALVIKIARALGVDPGELLKEPALAGKAEAPETGRSEDIPTSLAELLERSGAATRHLADANLKGKMDAMPLEDARRVAREARDEYLNVLEELGRIEDRFPHAGTKIADLLSLAANQLVNARLSLYVKVGARLVPVETRIERVDKDRVQILPAEGQVPTSGYEDVPEIEELRKLALAAP